MVAFMKFAWTSLKMLYEQRNEFFFLPLLMTLLSNFLKQHIEYRKPVLFYYITRKKKRKKSKKKV